MNCFRIISYLGWRIRKLPACAQFPSGETFLIERDNFSDCFSVDPYRQEVGFGIHVLATKHSTRTHANYAPGRHRCQRKFRIS